MANVRIFLNLDKELDGIVADTTIALTFAEAKFNSLVSRGGTLSNRFQLAKTANNKRQLGLLDDPNSDSDKPYLLYDCRIEVNGQPTFTGLAVISESQDYYFLRIYSGGVNFFELLGDKAINEIDLTSLDHNWTASEVNSRRQSATGCVYPNINYGRWTNKEISDRPHTDFFPAVYFKTILETAAAEEGYSLQNYNSKKIIPFTQGVMENRSRIDTQLTGLLGQVQSVDLDTEPISLSVITDEGNITGTRSGQNVIKVSKGSSLFVTAICSVAGTQPSPYTLVFGRGGLASERYAQKLIPSNTSGQVGYTGEITEEGSYGFYITRSGSGSLMIELSSIFPTSISVTGGVNTVQDGELISVRDTLPDIKIKDLFLYEAVRTNSLLITDPVNKTLEFVTMNSIRDKRQAALDWSGKVDTQTEPRREYRLGDYAQNNYLLYKDGSEDDPAYLANPNLGRGNFQVLDKALDKDKDWYTAPFVASGKSAAFTNEKLLTFIPFYSSSSVPYNEPDLDAGNRVLDVSIDNSSLITITGETPPATQANVTFEGFNENITNDYTALSEIFTRMKLLEVYVRLNPIDIANLDITRPVYLLNSYWFIREVSQYEVTSSKSTKLKLIRL